GPRGRVPARGRRDALPGRHRRRGGRGRDRRPRGGARGGRGGGGRGGRGARGADAREVRAVPRALVSVAAGAPRQLAAEPVAASTLAMRAAHAARAAATVVMASP